MKRNRAIITIIFILCNYYASSQILTCQLKDKDGNAISFVNAYASQSEYGTISDDLGVVSFDLEKIKPKDSISFSCIGYEDRIISMESLLTLKDAVITLNDRVYQMNDVEIIGESTSFKNIKSGVNKKSGFCRYKFYTFPGYPGNEHGLIIRNDQACYIENINFNLANISHDSMLYEINIYNYQDQIKEPLNNKRIFIELSKGNKKGTISIADQRIKVTNDFAITFEALQEKNYTSYINFKSKCTTKEVFLTKLNTGVWKEETGNIPSIWCNMRCIKE